uniref:PSP proline-rich domain-containing protein n=1 Tax=Chenopodium quinoa TaxID=63459 RepID=A0A803KV83_CHEQI
MVGEDVLRRCTSSESDDMKSLDSISIIKNNADGSPTTVNNVENGVFSIDDLGLAKEEIQGTQTMAEGFNKDRTLQPPIKRSEVVETLSVGQFSKVNVIQPSNNGGIGSLVGQNEELGTDKINGSKTPEDECNNKESSVRVVYSSLPSHSKRKLEEFLHQWSEWHTQHLMSAEDPAYCVESGEETYFPALRVGSEKPLALVQKRQRKESLSVNNDCSPLYDRGYAVGLASDGGNVEDSIVDMREAPRCFNCGSYNHPLTECKKPRDNAAVNSARKQFLSKKNQNGRPRVQTRYYQESAGGKFEGLKPGALSAETKKLLGLGELDPPPWLNRMREIGYPPGYIDEDEEDQPSGISIFGDEETQNLDGKNDLQLDVGKSQKKFIVDFPGINAVIPENADQMKWAAPVIPAPEHAWNQSNNRWNRARDSLNNGVFRGGYGQAGLRNHIEPPYSHFGLGLSPPLPHNPHHYFPREPFSPRGLSVPGGPRYESPGDAPRPFLHYNYGSI